MKQVIITEGNHILYGEAGTVVDFNDGELMFNLAKFEQNFEVCVDICKNAYGNLVMGVDNQKGAYVAQIVIPARKYDITQGQPDDNGVPTEIKKPIKLNMNNVIINLWGEV